MRKKEATGGGRGRRAVGERRRGRAVEGNQTTTRRPFNPFRGRRINVANAHVWTHTWPPSLKEPVKGGGAAAAAAVGEFPTARLRHRRGYSMASNIKYEEWSLNTHTHTHTNQVCILWATPVSQQLDPCWRLTSRQPIVAQRRARR